MDSIASITSIKYAGINADFNSGESISVSEIGITTSSFWQELSSIDKKNGCEFFQREFKLTKTISRNVISDSHLEIRV